MGDVVIVDEDVLGTFEVFVYYSFFDNNRIFILKVVNLDYKVRETGIIFGFLDVDKFGQLLGGIFFKFIEYQELFLYQDIQD